MAQDKMLKFLVEGLTRAFDKQEDCDVMFSVDGQTIGAHRLILNIHSQVLYEMAAGWTPDKDPIAIDDMSFDSFKALLRFMYNIKTTLCNDAVFTFLFASTRLKMNVLEELCVDHIAKSMGIENVCSFMNEAVNFKSRVLQEKCKEMFSEKTRETCKQPSIRNLSQPALSALLDIESTNVLEIYLFRRVEQWMKHQCRNQGLPVNGTNMREVIGDALYKIRFPTMTVQDFANSVTTIKGLLTDTEKAQVFEEITVFDNEEFKCPFSAKFRCQINTHALPLVSMAELCLQKVFYDQTNKQQCDLKSLLKSVKDVPNKKSIGVSVTSLRLVLQCYADLANSGALMTLGDFKNQDIRNELHDEFLAWPEMADSSCVSDTMTKYMDMRRKLNRLCNWAFG